MVLEQLLKVCARTFKHISEQCNKFFESHWSSYSVTSWMTVQDSIVETICTQSCVYSAK